MATPNRVSHCSECESYPFKPKADKLALFLKDCLSVGCLRGFQYIELYSRGREELVVTVKTSLSEPQFPLVTSVLKTQNDGGPPPASPCARDAELLAQDAVFLIGGYAKYKCPYVWVRSNHTKLLGIKDESMKKAVDGNKDTPLELTTTKRWKTEDQVKVWDMIEELIFSTLHPAPKNPFKIDTSKLQSMPILERALNAMALVNFLRKIIRRNPPYAEDVLCDIQTLLDIHFSLLPKLLHQKQTTN